MVLWKVDLKERFKIICKTQRYQCILQSIWHDDVIKWNHYWPFVRGIQRWPVSSPHKGQWCGALMFSLICVWTNRWANTRDAGDLWRAHAHYDVIVMNISANFNVMSTCLQVYDCWATYACLYLFNHHAHHNPTLIRAGVRGVKGRSRSWHYSLPSVRKQLCI